MAAQGVQKDSAYPFSAVTFADINLMTPGIIVFL
jgi:hypothetical protein